MGQGYKQRAADAKKNRNWRPAEGVYIALFKDHEFRQARKAKPGKPRNWMDRVEFKPLRGPSQEAINDFYGTKKRIIRTQFVISQEGFGFDEWLELLADLGADLAQCREEADDPQYEDLREIMTRAELTPFQVRIEIVHQDDGQNYNVKFREVQQIFGLPAGQQPQPVDTTGTVSPVISGGGSAVAGSAVGVQAPPPPGVPKNVPVFCLEGGQPLALPSLEALAKKVAAGYDGLVCIDEQNWVSPSEAGLVSKVAPPPPNTPTTPAAKKYHVLDAAGNVVVATQEAVQAMLDDGFYKDPICADGQNWVGIDTLPEFAIPEPKKEDTAPPPPPVDAGSTASQADTTTPPPPGVETQDAGSAENDTAPTPPPVDATGNPF